MIQVITGPPRVGPANTTKLHTPPSHAQRLRSAWPTCSRRAGLTRANGEATTAVSAGTRTVSRATTRGSSAVSGLLAVDGVMGPLTTRSLQHWVGSTPDGVFGPRSARGTAAQGWRRSRRRRGPEDRSRSSGQDRHAARWWATLSSATGVGAPGVPQLALSAWSSEDCPMTRLPGQAPGDHVSGSRFSTGTISQAGFAEETP